MDPFGLCRLYLSHLSIPPYLCIIMPLLTVTPGVELEYLDSGNASQRVLVIVHGHSWGAGSFQKCIDRASTHDLRVIALNRRGFSKSTRLTEYDLGLLRSKQRDNHIIFLGNRARELAQFIVSLASLGINGSITLLGWSLGNVFCLKMIEMMEENALGELNSQLRKLLSSYIIYDVPYWGLGLAPPFPAAASYAAQITGSVPRMRQHLALSHWLSAYFSYPEVQPSADPSALVLMDAMGNMGRQTTLSNIIEEDCFGSLELARDEITGESRAPRKAGFTPGGTRDDNTILQCIASDAFKVAAEKVLRSPKEGKLPITMLWGECSAWILQYTAWVVQSYPIGTGMTRLQRLLCITGGNHFSHWDLPDDFMNNCSELMNDRTPFNRKTDSVTQFKL